MIRLSMLSIGEKNEFVVIYKKNPDTEKMSNEGNFRQFRTPWYTSMARRDIKSQY